MAGAAIAELVTLPTDVAKTRLQVSGVAGSKQYAGMVDCMRTMHAEEGLASLWKGLQPALIRQVCYSTLAMVIYEPIRNLFVTRGEDPTYFQRLMAGGTAGCVSITVFNPTEARPGHPRARTGLHTTRASVCAGAQDADDDGLWRRQPFDDGRAAQGLPQ